VHASQRQSAHGPYVQVEYILTDKTGTLTENIMVLKVCSIAGQQYGQFSASGNLLAAEGKADSSSTSSIPSIGGVLNDPRLTTMLDSNLRERSRSMGPVDFFRCMAVNNSVVPSMREDGHYVYKVGVVLQRVLWRNESCTWC
jgi:phospholipid-translocating ATPase